MALKDTYRLSNNTSTGIQAQLHLTHLLVELFHERNDEIDQLVLQHLISMEICNQETNVISLIELALHLFKSTRSNRNSLSSENDKVLGTHHHESRELMTQDLFDFICLFHFDAESDGIDGSLDQDSFLLVS